MATGQPGHLGSRVGARMAMPVALVVVVVVVVVVVGEAEEAARAGMEMQDERV